MLATILRGVVAVVLLVLGSVAVQFPLVVPLLVPLVLDVQLDDDVVDLAELMRFSALPRIPMLAGVYFFLFSLVSSVF